MPTIYRESFKAGRLPRAKACVEGLHGERCEAIRPSPHCVGCAAAHRSVLIGRAAYLPLVTLSVAGGLLYSRTLVTIA
jgi:hypothetical protein